MNRMHALTDLSAREAAALMRSGELRVTDYAQALLKKLDREAARALVERTRELLAAAGAK